MIWRNASEWLSPGRVTRVTSFFYDLVPNCLLKMSGTNRTRLLDHKSELDAAQSATQPAADHSRLTIDDLDIQEENKYTDDDSDEKILTSRNGDCWAPSCQTIICGLQLRQTETCRVTDEAKALVPSPISSTRARIAAAAQEGSVESRSLDLTRSDDDILRIRKADLSLPNIFIP